MRWCLAALILALGACDEIARRDAPRALYAGSVNPRCVAFCIGLVRATNGTEGTETITIGAP